MASVKQILFVLGISIILIALIGWWVNRTAQTPELLLDADEELTGPLSPEELKVANPTVTNTMNRVAIMKTNLGTIEIELFEDKMPITTGNFVKLVEEKFYDGIKFHRVISDFMIQAGDPNTKSDNVASYGKGGPGYTIRDEFVEDPLLTNIRGTIAMANTGQPDSGGSQFFINLRDNSPLDFNVPDPNNSKHPVFGRVTKGMDIVDKIASQEVTPGNNLPVKPIVIESVTISTPTATN